MLKFFKQIRKKLLNEGNLKKYLIYAFGEILLVMLGILLALQVNNLNQDRKDRILERVLLNGIKEDLSSDTLDIIYNLNIHRTTLRNEITLLNLMSNSSTEIVDSINFADALGISLSLALHKTALRSFQNSPPQIIQNEELKNKILRHYDFFYRSLELFEDDNPDYHFYTKKLPYFEKHFYIGKNQNQLFLNPQSKNYFANEYMRREIKASNIKAIKEDHAFALILSECIFSRSNGINYYEEALIRISELCFDIDKELNKK